MKHRATIVAAVVVFAASTATAQSSDSSASSAGVFFFNSSTSSPSDVGFDSQSGSLPPAVVDPDQCLGLPRNTVLASCPAPCLRDAPCIVYDQDASHTKLTGCDYGTRTGFSFCTSEPGQTCEFQCFPLSEAQSMFAFEVESRVENLGPPEQRRPDDPSAIAMRWLSSQPNNFVTSFGRLNLSDEITSVGISGDYGNMEQLVEVDVDPALLESSPSVTMLHLYSLPLTSDLLASILVSAPQLTMLDLRRTNLETLSWEIFAPVPKLDYMLLLENPISLISGSDTTMPVLRVFAAMSSKLTGFELRAPKLENLVLSDNKLVRIPESVFTYGNLQTLDLSENPIIRPLVLTAQQLQFLEGLSDLGIELVNPPDQAIVSRLPDTGSSIYGNYSDGLDLSLLLVGATETVLRGNPTLPVLLIGSEQAATYNDVLEVRARMRSPTSTPETQGPNGTTPIYIPPDSCQGMSRNTLFSYCAGNCPRNGACVAYDQNDRLSEPSGCDYGVASESSFCTRAKANATTCEFQCFPAYVPLSQFKFLIPFKSPLGAKITPQSDVGDLTGLKTTEIPYLTNWFVETIGVLNLTATVSEVWIAGGQSQTTTPGMVADVVVAPKLLSKAPSVTSLSLLNIDLSKSDVAAIFASTSPALTSLTLANTMLTAVPEAIFSNLPQLKTLILAQNGINSLEIKMTTLEKLSTLDLSENVLTTLDINAPNLKTLDLSGNELVRIPLSVFSLTTIETLNLEDNPLALPLVLTQTQLTVLKSVANLRLSSPADLALSSLGATATIELTDGTVIVGTTAVVGGVPVVIVSEQIASQYNDQLEQQQKESTPTLSTASGGTALPSGTTSAPGLPNEQSSAGGSRIGELSETTVNSSSGAVGSDLSTTSGGGAAPANKEDTKPTTDQASKVSLATTLTLGGGGAVVFVVLLLLFIISRRRRAGTDKESRYVPVTDNADETNRVDENGSSAGQVFAWWRDDDMLSHRVRARDISDDRVIGTSSGFTWLVNYRGGSRKLVSKRLVHGQGPAHDAKVMQLVAEAKIACSLRYHTIVPFVGVAWTDKTDLQVLYEYMPNGDLGSYLARTDASSLPWMSAKLQIAIEIVEALVYTHSFNPPLLHRDLKSSNVLLDENFSAKLSGFGCARAESDNDTMTTTGIGSSRWLAPEILLGSSGYSTPSDIYSFGVMLCELDTHQLPYEKDAEGVSSEAKLLQCVARGELRPSVSVSCPVEIREIVEACLAYDPQLRPTALEIAHTLRSLRRRDQSD